MEIINIIGWYGTETIGDRGILGGLIKVFSNKYSEFTILLGSFFPFFSNRCLFEDLDFYKELSNNQLKSISTYNVSDIHELKTTIQKSTMLCFGGGPLMDIPYIYNMEYAFSYAKKLHIPTAILGCGVGPLQKKSIINSTIRLIDMADIVIFRDSLSFKTYQNLGGKKAPLVCIDPACFCAVSYYNQQTKSNTEHFCAMNFRDVTHDQYSSSFLPYYEQFFIELIQNLLSVFQDDIFLIPMHTFYHGGDDRYFLNRLAAHFNSNEHIKVINKPLSLKQTLYYFYQADLCYGMRFHSVLFQTILNGNNIILDYTNPQTGKTSGLLNQLNLKEDYQHSYYSLVDNYPSAKLVEPHNNPAKTHEYINDCFSTYVKSLCL